MEDNELYTDENGIDLTDAVCLISSSMGQYIPQMFAQEWGQFIKEGEDKTSLLNGPDNEWYNDAWWTIEQNTTIEIEGKQYTLYHDGDLWAIPVKE
jgi:hypothetical protein